MLFQIKHKYLKVFSIIVALIFCKNISAQQYQKENYGANVGIVIAFGTHFNRLGVVIGSYYQSNHFQLSPELRLYFNAKSLGPKSQYFEAVTSIGILYGYSKSQTLDTNYFYSPISNQTSYKNSIGYSFNIYLNSKNTTQQTGIIALQWSHFSFIIENDLFARPKFDRYRTGAFLLQYQKNKSQFSINTSLFTGEMGHKIKDLNYPYSHLYEKPKKDKHTNFSNGLLSAQVKFSGAYYQTYQANIGVDSEKIRHIIQNRFIHDVFNSKKHKNAHIPMIDANGNQYLFKKNQKVKPLKLYINGFINPFIFY